MNKMRKLADRLEKKYAFLGIGEIDANQIKNTVVNSLQDALVGADSYGKLGTSFLMMLQKDHTTLSVNVHRDGDKVYVDPIDMPYDHRNAYKNLAANIQNYLSTNLTLFPTKINGKDVAYNKFHCLLRFTGNQ